MIEEPVSRMKPKINRKGSTEEVFDYDCCETPGYALDPLLRYIPKDWLIWECAAGTGRMVRNLEQRGYTVLGSSIETGHNFFTTECDGANMILTNPPFSCKPQFVARCYELGLPFALILPVESIGTQKIQRMMREFGAEILLLDKRINFFMPRLGWGGSGAQFPVLWFCHRILPAPICYGEIVRYDDQED
jgi:hypothetical protein